MFFSHLWVLHLKDDTDHGKNYSHQEAQLHADQSRGWHSDQPHNGIISASTPLCWDVLELPQCPPKADNDDTGENTFLEIIEERCKEEEHEKDDQGADQTRYLMEEQTCLWATWRQRIWLDQLTRMGLTILRMNVTCVWQPVESFTMVFASAALVVKQWKKEGMMLQQPMASISWLGRTV